MLIHIVFSITLTYWSVFLTTIQNQKLPFHKLQSPELSPPSARPSGNLHRHLNKTFESCNFFQVESSILQMALYNPPIHLFAVLWKVLFFGWRQHPSIQTESLTATSSTSPSRPLTAARQTQQHTRLIKHVLFFFFFPAGFYLHDHVWRSVHFDQFFGFSHMASLGQPDLIKDSQTVYMHQITPHALCSAASGVALQSPPPFPSALCSLPPSFPPLLPKTSWLQTPLFSLPPNPLFAISHWKRCSLLPAPTFFILASHFHFTQSCFQWPTPLISLQFSPVPAARGEKFASWYCYIIKKLPAQSGTTLWARSAILFSVFHSRCWPHSQILNLCLISFLFPRQWVHTLRLYCCLTIVFSFVCPHLLLTGSIYWS